MKISVIPVIFFIIAFTGCAAQQKYYWGSYESALYRHYKNPGEIEDFTQKLGEIIEKGEQKGKKVPPGIHAEYGYMLLVQGKNREAIVSFEREKQEWPESAYLMDSMIKTAGASQEEQLKTIPSDVGAGGAQE